MNEKKRKRTNSDLEKAPGDFIPTTPTDATTGPIALVEDLGKGHRLGFGPRHRSGLGLGSGFGFGLAVFSSVTGPAPAGTQMGQFGGRSWKPLCPLIVFLASLNPLPTSLEASLNPPQRPWTCP